MELGNLLLKFAAICAFLDGLDTSYQSWKDMYLGGYSNNNVEKDGKIIEPKIAEIFKLLIDRKSGAKV